MSQPPQPPSDPSSPDGYGVPPAAGEYPPPSTNKTGLYVGLGAAGLLALVAIIIGVVVLSGGDDERIVSGSDSSQSAEPSDEPSSEPTAEESDEAEPTEDVSEAPEEGQLVGTGYTYELPDEWNDISAEVLAQNPPGAIDTVATWGTDIESGRANLITERQTAEATDPEELRESWEGNLGTAVGVTPVSGPDTEIDGEKAISATLSSTNGQDVSVEQTAYLVIVDGAVYSITLSAEEGDDGAQDEFDDILDSWSWE